MQRNIPLVSWDQLSPLCPLLNLFAGGAVGNGEGPDRRHALLRNQHCFGHQSKAEL